MKIHVVAEGKLEIPVANRLIDFCGHQRGRVYPVRGSGNIGKDAVIYSCLADDDTAVLVLTDFMDSKSPCPAAARKSYLGKKAADVPRNFLLRFAVNELESWLLTDPRILPDCLAYEQKKFHQLLIRYRILKSI